MIRYCRMYVCIVSFLKFFQLPSFVSNIGNAATLEMIDNNIKQNL